MQAIGLGKPLEPSFFLKKKKKKKKKVSLTTTNKLKNKLQMTNEVRRYNHKLSNSTDDPNLRLSKIPLNLLSKKKKTERLFFFTWQLQQ